MVQRALKCIVRELWPAFYTLVNFFAKLLSAEPLLTEGIFSQNMCRYLLKVSITGEKKLNLQEKKMKS